MKKKDNSSKKNRSQQKKSSSKPKKPAGRIKAKVEFKTRLVKIHSKLEKIQFQNRMTPPNQMARTHSGGLYPQTVSSRELPFSYNVTKLVLMVRDPYCVFCYWDFSGETWNWIQMLFREHGSNLRPVLRVYDVTDILFNGRNAHLSYDIDISLETKNWYVHLAPDRDWIFDLALVDRTGKFYLIARGNRVKTPRDGPSDVIDEEWMISDFDEIYALSGGFGFGLSSGEIKKLIKRRYLAQKTIFRGNSGETSSRNKS